MSTVWVTQEPTRRVGGQVVSMFERKAAEKFGGVRMLIGAHAKIEDPSVQRELWTNVAQIDPDKDHVVLSGNTAIIFAVGYVISALHPGKLNVLLYRSKDFDEEGRSIINPNYRSLVLDIEATKPEDIDV